MGPGQMLRGLLGLLWLGMGIQSAFVNNYIKDYDTQDYVWLDCNDDFFETTTFTNENVTAYVNLCRPLPQSSFDQEELPIEIIRPTTANIFIKRLVRREYKYLFLTLDKNNGIDISKNGQSIKIFWESKFLDEDIYLELSPASGTTEVSLRVEDTFTTGDTARDRRKVLKSRLVVDYPENSGMLRAEGIISHDVWYKVIRGFILSLAAVVLLVPRERSYIGKWSLQDYTYFWLATNLIVDITVQYFGEKLPIANSILVLLLPTVLSILLMTRVPLRGYSPAFVALALFYVAWASNYVIFTMFYCRTMWANDHFLHSLIYCIFIPVLLRFGLLCLNDLKTFDRLWIPYAASMFLFLRIMQMIESPKGMLSRTFKTPQLGEYSQRISSPIWLIFMSIPYQLLASMYLKSFPLKDTETRKNRDIFEEADLNLSANRL